MENSSPDPSPRNIRFHEATLITLRAIFKKNEDNNFFSANRAKLTLDLIKAALVR